MSNSSWAWSGCPIVILETSRRFFGVVWFWVFLGFCVGLGIFLLLLFCWFGVGFLGFFWVLQASSHGISGKISGHANPWSAAEACVVPGGYSRHDAPATPTERQRKVKPKGKAVFNLNFQLFSESRWEDGDMVCSLDCHESPEAAEVPNARAGRSIIHTYVQWGKGCWLHCNTAPIFSWLSPVWTWTSRLPGALSLGQKRMKLSKMLILSGGLGMTPKALLTLRGPVRSHCATLEVLRVLTWD